MGSVRPRTFAGAPFGGCRCGRFGFRLWLCGRVWFVFLVLFDEPVLLKKLAFDRRENVRMLFEEGARVVTPLANALFTVAVPSARLVDDACLDTEVEHVAGAADALPKEDIELTKTERRGELVLDDLDPGNGCRPTSEPTFDRTDAADVEALRLV